VHENESLRGTKENILALNNKINSIVANLQQIINDLKELNSSLNPNIKLIIGNKPKYGGNTTIALELFEKMNNGIHITRKLIESTYNVDDKKAHNIMTNLQRMKGVEKVKENDGKTIRLFIR